MYRYDGVTRWAAACLVLVMGVLAAGCGSGDEPEGNRQGGAPERTAWPQPQGGRLTEQMCDLLGPDDFAAVGLGALAWSNRSADPKQGHNTVTCHSIGDTWLRLDLQPDAASAALLYKTQLIAHKRRMAESNRKGDLQLNGVRTAQESWFDASDLDAAHEAQVLTARRGAVVLHLQIGFLNSGKASADVRKAGGVLAETLFGRIPEVGTASTGKPHRLTLTGRGTSGPVDITYYDPVLGEQVKVGNVTLPYTKSLDFPWFGRVVTPVQLMVTPRQPTLTSRVSCEIQVDGVSLARRGPEVFAGCSGSFLDPRTP
ncbi:hypothetical protein [Actinoplanes teichomyceticus]|uniref:hypothetical protein n=1 Tax=Actinoplanes teichomyceticus TaxID=1867 RepID=UPI0011EB24D4|nr:hypothetical protein [Actinoplanes teichomyceticus]